MAHPLAEYLRRPDPGNPDREISQQEFARAIGVSQSAVSRFLSGQIQGFDQKTAERVVRETNGRVTLLDCLYNTPFYSAAGKKKPSPTQPAKPRPTKPAHS